MLPSNSQVVLAKTPLGAEFIADFSIDESLPGVSSHFPQKPIIAGYMQLQWVESFFAQIAPTLCISSIRDIKFLQPLLPPADLKIRLLLSAERNSLQLFLTQGSVTLTKGAFDIVSRDC